MFKGTENHKISKKFAKIGLSTTKGGGINPDFCLAPQIFFRRTRLSGKAPLEHGHALRTWFFK